MKKPILNRSGRGETPLKNQIARGSFSGRMMGKASLFLAVALCFAGCRKNELKDSSASLEATSSKSAGGTSAIAGLTPFKVMSFNVRHNDENDPQGIDEREPLIKQIIIDNTPDIVGCQEFSDNGFATSFTNSMNTLGYSVYWNEAASHNGNPRVIYYKRSRFTLQAEGTWDIDVSIKNTATYVILMDNTNSQKYFVCNSHWQWNDPAIRMENSQKLVAGINLYNTQGLPKIILGDFNAIPGTAEVNNLKNSLDLVDGLGDSQGGLTLHGWTATGTKKLDWIMSDRSMSFLSSQVITTSYNGFWPSDHWPVMVTYVPAILGAEHVDANGGSAVNVTKYYFADVNGDGKDDKIFWRPNYDSGKVRVFLSNGDGTFAAAVSHLQSLSTVSTTRFYFADLSNDGKADLIRWDPTDASKAGHSFVYLATTAGNFSATAIDNGQGPSQVATTVYNFADVNGDGYGDKIFWRYNYDSGRTRVYLGVPGAPGTFSGTVVAAPEGASDSLSTNFWYADVNGDNKDDKILWHPALNGGSVKVFLSDGDGTFTESTSFSSGAGSASGNTKFYFADINGDNRADKVYWNPGNYFGQLKAYFSQTNNTFEGPIYSLRGNSNSANTQYFFADISGPVSSVRKADQIRWRFDEFSGTMRNYFGN